MIQRQSPLKLESRETLSVHETENEGEDHVIFYQDPRWENGSMLFFHAIRDKDDMTVSVLMEPLARDGKIIFKMSKKTFEELLWTCETVRGFVRARKLCGWSGR